MTAKRSAASQGEALDRLLEANEAATQLGICKRTLRRLVIRGKLETVKLGTRTVRYRCSDIMRLQASGVTM